MRTALLTLSASLLAACSSPPPMSCTPACAPGYHCEAGACVSDGPPDLAVGDLASGPVGCASDGDCPIGTFCKANRGAPSICTLGCMSDARCGGGTMKCCGGRCLDTSADPSNCGQCGMTCTAKNAQASCSSGQCATGACTAGFGDCDGQSANGCETDLRVDPANCGACGSSCKFPNGVGACADGCYLAACSPGFGDCNGDPTDGCEASVLADVKNCGACAAACAALPNAQTLCESGACLIGPCSAGYSDCNGDPRDGCEANLSTDPNNCNRCGSVCPQQNPFCRSGICSSS